MAELLGPSGWSKVRPLHGLSVNYLAHGFVFPTGRPRMGMFPSFFPMPYSIFGGVGAGPGTSFSPDRIILFLLFFLPLFGACSQTAVYGLAVWRP